MINTIIIHDKTTSGVTKPSLLGFLQIFFSQLSDKHSSFLVHFSLLSKPYFAIPFPISQ